MHAILSVQLPFGQTPRDAKCEIRVGRFIEKPANAPLEDKIVPYRHQVAGHPRTFYLSSTGMHVYKITSAQEIGFYKSLGRLPHLKDLQRHIPKFEGVYILANETAILQSTLPPSMYPSHAFESIKLENLLFGIRNPNYADLKLGKVLYCCCASEEKRSRTIERSRGTTSSGLGLRISGFYKWNPASHAYEEFSKTQGYLLTRNTIFPALRDFFTVCRESHPRPTVLSKVLRSLLYLRRVFLTTDVMFHSTSIFIAYSGSPADSDPEVTVKIIDFARSHATGRSIHGDGGFLCGLDNLIAFLRLMSCTPDH